MRLAEGPLWIVVADRLHNAGNVARLPRPEPRPTGHGCDDADGQAGHRCATGGLRPLNRRRSMRFMLLETYGSCSGHSDKPSGSSGGIHVCPTGAVLPRPTGDGGTPSAEMQERPQSAQKTSGSFAVETYPDRVGIVGVT